MTVQQIFLSQTTEIPEWAILEREIIARLNKASVEFVNKYTRVDGTLKWKDSFGSMDGSDDPYEAFQYLALLYAIGGSEEVYELARKMWESITLQWTEYGQIHREFDGYYDWMHHGEAYIYFYFFGLTKPESLMDRQRARRFSHMYMGKDEEAQNYDPATKLIRSPLTGSRGPRFRVTEEDWFTHRTVLDDYLAPYEDIPGVDFESLKCQWSDPIIYARLIEFMNQRMNRGDVPLNLNATSLITHSYLYSHDEEEKKWVLEYLENWAEYAVKNGGIMPDNVGLSGTIGEYNDGKWWGGYYGWRWPHGLTTILEPLLNACMNAVLLSNDPRYYDIFRKQYDVNWQMRESIDGKLKTPHRHFDKGWTDYREASPRLLIHLWATSLDDQDLARINEIPRTFDWSRIVTPGLNGYKPAAYKHYIANTLGWFEYIQGRNPNYAIDILRADLNLLDHQEKVLQLDIAEPSTWDSYVTNNSEYDIGIDIKTIGYQIHAWQWFSPVYFEGLAQMVFGGPMHISHGGLQYGKIRPFDADLKRPGLPAEVALKVESISQTHVRLSVSNISSDTPRRIILQAGNFGENLFTSISVMGSEESTEINSKWVELVLAPSSTSTLDCGIALNACQPTYETPWSDRSAWDPLITGRAQSNFFSD